MKKTNLDAWICETEGLSVLTREKLEQLQLEKLNAALKKVTSRGGFYKNCPDRLDSLEQLKTLPFTTSQDLAGSPMAFLTSSQSAVERVISGATSGTAGPAKRVFYTARDTENTVGFFAAGIGEMLRPGERCLIDFPFTGPFGLGDLIAKAVERLGGAPVRGLPGETWGTQLENIRHHRPQCYIGFPTRLLTLARLWGGDFPIQRALLSADACPQGVMDALETRLGTRLYPHYGSREMGLGGAVTCPAFQGMHLRENHIIPEIVDEGGNVLPRGQWGELVITTIGLEAMPLIRYRTGDHTRILPPCPCGGVTCRLDRVTRREPGPISMEQLDDLLLAIPELADFAARFDGKLHLTARTLHPSAEAVIRETLKKALPHLPFTLVTEPITLSQTPLYPGKRFVK